MYTIIIDMTGSELRHIRKQLGLSQHKFAPLLGIHWNTLARFERGEVNISEPVAILARLRLELAEREGKPKQQKALSTRKRS